MVDNNKSGSPLAVVTGADGFIGSHLTETLLGAGYRVRALSQYNSFNFWGWLEGIHNNNLEIVSGDVRDPSFCRELVRGADTVFHLAALIAIPYSYVAPDSYVDTNIRGTLIMLEAVKAEGCGRLLVTSTSEVYGTAQYVPIAALHPRQPQSPYSATKIGAAALAQRFYNAFELPVVIVRPFNTYGPRQSARAIIPTIISQIASGNEVIKVGDLTPTRDFNYVTVTARGFLCIAQAPLEIVVGLEINIATNSEITMADTLNIIAELMHWGGRYEVDPERLRPSRSEVRRLWGNNAKIERLTEWRPQVSIRQGLQNTIDWFCNADNLKRYKTDIYNR